MHTSRRGRGPPGAGIVGGVRPRGRRIDGEHIPTGTALAMTPRMTTRYVLLAASLLCAAVFAPSSAQAQAECMGGLVGTPNQSGGGGCSCGGGSILINNTDIGDTYQYADDYDNDGIEDDFDDCPFAANNNQADDDGDG